VEPVDVSELTLPETPLSLEELQLAARNRGMPLEGLRYDITPTGMHYLLVHFDIPYVDGSTFRLEVGGAVSKPLSLTLDDIRRRPAVTIPVTMECAGNGRARLNPRPISQPWIVEAIGTATWTGTPLAGVLDEAGLNTSVVDIAFLGADAGVQGGEPHRYGRSLSTEDAMRPEVLLAYEMNGRPLEPQHGYPLRLLVPGWYGMTSVKWLDQIEALTEPFDGYQQRVAYKYQENEDDAGTPVTRIHPRALMIPPGVPEFLTRTRIVEPGEVVVTGRAWSGLAPIERVEFGVDGSWSDATLDDPVGEFAWRGWSASFSASPGEHELSCRASDAAGNVQPTDQPWNVQGMSNNLVQRVAVMVE
jgi:DMSO/TMAO reductase YedYZ molybdopterin-dependent catalytic subunit